MRKQTIRRICFHSHPPFLREVTSTTPNSGQKANAINLRIMRPHCYSTLGAEIEYDTSRRIKWITFSPDALWSCVWQLGGCQGRRTRIVQSWQKWPWFQTLFFCLGSLPFSDRTMLWWRTLLWWFLWMFQVLHWFWLCLHFIGVCWGSIPRTLSHQVTGVLWCRSQPTQQCQKSEVLSAVTQSHFLPLLAKKDINRQMKAFISLSIMRVSGCKRFLSLLVTTGARRRLYQRKDCVQLQTQLNLQVHWRNVSFQDCCAVFRTCINSEGTTKQQKDFPSTFGRIVPC